VAVEAGQSLGHSEIAQLEGLAPMISQRAVVGLIVGALGFPVALCVLYALVQLLEAMQDFAGADVVRRVNLGLFALWAINLVALLIVSAIHSVGRPPRGPDDLEP
jgi:hypothetical protein